MKSEVVTVVEPVQENDSLGEVIRATRQLVSVHYPDANRATLVVSLGDDSARLTIPVPIH